MPFDRASARHHRRADQSPTDAQSAERRRLLLFSASYVIVWLVGWHVSTLIESGEIASLWFLPAGLRFFCLLTLGWTGVLIELATQSIFTVLQIATQPGAAVSNLFSTHTLWRLFYQFGMLAAYALVALPLRRRMRDGWDFTRPAHGTLFIAAALAASSLAALAGTLSLIQLGVITPQQFPTTFPPWLIGDFIAIITLTPLLLARLWPRLENYLYQGRWERRRKKSARPVARRIARRC